MTVTEPTAETLDDTARTDTGAPADAPATDDAPVTDEVLVEEISIDGMCGVY